ncbi:MAG: DUF447 family protein [Clostridiales bacterium]|nr:DUF447 family protein [Clostridiales bacterium]MCF8021880.1 DUF447 family protein [Clostridiales bacterium]
MSKILGDRLPQEVVDLFNAKVTTVVLTTVTAENEPHAMPIHVVCAPNDKTVLMALLKNHQSTENIKNNSSAMITVMDGEDIAAGIKGTAKIAREPMEANKAMVIIEFTVKEVKSDTTPTVIVTQGVRFKHRSEKTEGFLNSAFNELYQYGNMS